MWAEEKKEIDYPKIFLESLFLKHILSHNWTNFAEMPVYEDKYTVNVYTLSTNYTAAGSTLQTFFYSAFTTTADIIQVLRWKLESGFSFYHFNHAI